MDMNNRLEIIKMPPFIKTSDFTTCVESTAKVDGFKQLGSVSGLQPTAHTVGGKTDDQGKV